MGECSSGKNGTKLLILQNRETLRGGGLSPWAENLQGLRGFASVQPLTRSVPLGDSRVLPASASSPIRTRKILKSRIESCYSGKIKKATFVWRLRELSVAHNWMYIRRMCVLCPGSHSIHFFSNCYYNIKSEIIAPLNVIMYYYVVVTSKGLWKITWITITYSLKEEILGYADLNSVIDKFKDESEITSPEERRKINLMEIDICLARVRRPLLVQR